MFSIVICPPFKTSYRITTNSEFVVHQISLYFGAHVSSSNTNAIFDITITAAKDYYVVVFQDESIKSFDPLFEVNKIIRYSSVYDDNFVALHGAAVEHMGNAFLLLAPTQSGKTTLTTFLVNNGMNFITDDCVLIDKENMMVYPYCEPIHLRKGGVDVLKNVGLNLNLKSVGNDSNNRRFVYTPKNQVSTFTSIKRIYFIQRNTFINSITPITTSERIAQLMKSSIVEFNITLEILQTYCRISQITCEKLNYKDMYFVQGVLMNAQ